MTGPANQAYRLSSWLEQKKIRSPIITSNYCAKKSPKKQKMGKVKVVRYPILFKVLKYFFTPSMKPALEGFDVIHSHNCRSYQTAQAFKAAQRDGKPFVITLHGGLLTYKHLLSGIMKLPYQLYDLFGGRKMVTGADAVIVNSKKEYKDAISYGISKKKVHLIPVGINVKEYTPRRKTASGQIKVLFVGRISRNRNVEQIIHAANILKHRNKNGKKYQFIIVGGEAKSSDTSKSGYLDELKQLAKDLRVSDIMKFVGEKKDAALRKYYKTSDVFAYTSLSENFGQTILEAAAAGLPMICTRVGVATEIIKDGKNGYLVNTKPSQLADKLVKLSSKSLREKFGKSVRRIAKRDFDWNNIMKKYMSIYKRILRDY